MANRRPADLRDLVRTPTGTFYAKRNPDGTFKSMDEIGRSLRADRRQAARRIVPAGFGDVGDQRRRRRH